MLTHEIKKTTNQNAHKPYGAVFFVSGWGGITDMKKGGVLSSASEYHGPQCKKKKLAVQPDRPVVDVLQVHAHPFFETDIVPSGSDLPGAGQAGLHGKPSPLPVLVFFNFAGYGWPGADQTHFTF